MAIDRIDFPNSAPVDITDWEKIIDVAEFNTLGTEHPADWDFSGDTIKQGVQIMIGGSIYLSTTSTAITGTPSEYVKITPAGATASAAYVASLTGVSWNSVWNFYEDGSGNAYLFNEAKAVAEGVVSSPKTTTGKYSELAYAAEMVVTGQTILARDGGTVLINKVTSDIGIFEANGIVHVGGSTDGLLIVGSSGLVELIGTDSTLLTKKDIGLRAITGAQLYLNTEGNVLVKTTTNITNRALHVAGNVAITGSLLEYRDNNLIIASNSVDGADNKSLYLCSGGAADAARGACIQLFGNEFSGVAGEMYLNSGTGKNVYMQNASGGNVIIRTTSNLGEAVQIGAGGLRVTGTTDSMVVDSTGLMKINRISEFTAAAGITFNHVIKVDSISERIASAGVTVDGVLLIDGGATFTSTVRWRNYFADLSNPTQNEVFDAVAPWVPNTGDFLAIHGQYRTSSGSGVSGVSLSWVRRNSSTVLQFRGVDSTGNSILAAANDGDGTVFAKSISVMSNFNAIS